jgi:hypothetical protein
MKTRSMLSLVLLTFAVGISAGALGAGDRPADSQPVGVAAAPDAAMSPAADATKPAAKHSHLLEKVGTAPTPPASPKVAPAREVHRHWRDAK